MNKVVESKLKELSQLVVEALEDIKAVDIRVLDVESISSFTDHMIIASGTSVRQVKALANSVVVKVKEAGFEILGSEGENPGEWILIDIGDVVVHIMVPQVRDFYNLEKLWSVDDEEAHQKDNESGS